MTLTSMPAIGSTPGAPAFPTFGDAVAMYDPRSRTLTQTNAAWRASMPNLQHGSTDADLIRTLPAIRPSLARFGATSLPDAEPNTDTDDHAWKVETEASECGHLAIRISDWRECGRAFQRQLDDREGLLFSSRVVTVGEMATTLAHELNQPIAAAANLLRGLKTRVARRRGGLDKDESTALNRSIDQIMFASRVIARIRDYTHSHKPRPTTIDLAGLLGTCARLLDWELQRCKVNLTVTGTDTNVVVHGDAVMLQQVIVNLMRNALDALRKDPPRSPRLSLRLIPDDRQVEVQVSDNGCGLSDDDTKRLFVPFASSKPSGMGIGLSICRSFVELHQGRLWFSDNPDRGTTFHLTLPVHISQPTQSVDSGENA